MQAETRHRNRIGAGTILLGGLVYFIVRGLWSWKTWFAHQPPAEILVNLLGLLVETVVFTVAFFLLQGLQSRRQSPPPAD